MYYIFEFSFDITQFQIFTIEIQFYLHANGFYANENDHYSNEFYINVQTFTILRKRKLRM